MGRQQKAEEIESEMRKLLAFADTDDFILQRLKTDKN